MDQDQSNRLWVERLRLTGFRNYDTLSLDLDERPVVLAGENGAGKTNLMEAVSLLVPGRGLGRAPFTDMIAHGASNGWAVHARVNGVSGEVDIGTGYDGAADTTARTVRVDGQPARSASALGDHVRAVWLTPAMDGLFTGAPGERRRFLDRLIQGLDKGYRSSLSQFERAMRQRNKLLETGEISPSLFDGLETQMAETGVAIAAARLDMVARLRAIAGPDEADLESPFPYATLALEGPLERHLEHQAAVDVEDIYRDMLVGSRERDRAARRTLEGPHRSDLIVGHGPKGAPANKCSTGEQKALLIGLVLAYARLLASQHGGFAPLILLDEIAAHLDDARRTALFAAILELNAQAWMTGTDAEYFSALGENAQVFTVRNGGISR